MKTYKIDVPYTNGVLMTADQILKFHNELTIFLNDNYDELTKDEDEDEEGRDEAENERNIDHANDMKI